MSTTVHFIDVGQGNMVLVQCANGANFVVDCNITEDNKTRVLDYVGKQIGQNGKLRAFICTHRDADHMRGVRTLHNRFSIGKIWDSGYPGTTTDSSEYLSYMNLRREIGSQEITKKTRDDFGRTRFRYLSAKDDRLPANANDQGIVIKVEHRTADMSGIRGSIMLTGDGSGTVWKNGIKQDYTNSELSCDILMAAHHGSYDFFDDPDSNNHYRSHIQAMSPDMTIVSVGDNPHGHPDETALRLYRENSTGADNGDKVYRTDRQHTMKLTLKDGGGWQIVKNQ